MPALRIATRALLFDLPASSMAKQALASAAGAL
jgi:hypothetical protein